MTMATKCYHANIAFLRKCNLDQRSRLFQAKVVNTSLYASGVATPARMSSRESGLGKTEE